MTEGDPTTMTMERPAGVTAGLRTTSTLGAGRKSITVVMRCLGSGSYQELFDIGSRGWEM